MEPLTQPRLPRAWETDKVPRTQCSFLLIIFHHVTVFSLKGFILIKLSPWPKYIYQIHLLSIECNLILFHSSNPSHFPRFSSNPTSSAVACSDTMAWPCLSFLSNPAFNISVIFIFHYIYRVLPSYPELISHSPNKHSLCPGYFLQAEAPSFLSPTWKRFASMEETHVASLLPFKAVFTPSSPHTLCPLHSFFCLVFTPSPFLQRPTTFSTL